MLSGSRDGVEKSYFVCQRRGADAPQLCSIFLPAKLWPARIADQSAVRAGAGRRKETTMKIQEHLGSLADFQRFQGRRLNFGLNTFRPPKWS